MSRNGFGRASGAWPRDGLIRKSWSQEEIYTLHHLYPTASKSEVLRNLPGRTWQSILRRACTLKVARLIKPIQKEAKICKRCGKRKSRYCFEATAHGGSRAYCRECYGAHRWEMRACKRRPRKVPDQDAKYRKNRKNNLRGAYGITVEDYENMYRAQEGKCGICVQEHGVLCVDHNHLTANIRGLVCHACNLFLGRLEKQPWLIVSVQAYLTKYGEALAL
mgnify:CR=1 FL=1